MNATQTRHGRVALNPVKAKILNNILYFNGFNLAGAPGFEPGDGGIKIRCLTTWLRPIATRVGVLRRTGAPARGTYTAHPRPINAAVACLWSIFAAVFA